MAAGALMGVLPTITFGSVSYTHLDVYKRQTLMLAQHHDCWIVPYNGKPGDTWADKVDRWTAVTRGIAEEKISGLFGEIPGTIPEYIRVYNTLASTRSGRVEVSLPEDLMNSDLKIFDSKGIMVPSQVFKDRIGNGKLCFEASVPAMGYSTCLLYTSRCV